MQTSERERELHTAAFHAWITLGEILAKRRPTREELESVYALLTAALKRYRAPPKCQSRNS